MAEAARDYISLWRCRDVPPWELEVVLMQIFGNARVPSARSIEYVRDGGLALRLEYTTSDTLRAIVAGGELNPADVARIGAAIATDLLAVGPNVVSRKILFTEYPVEGVFRRAGSFQLFPVAEGLPKAGPHDWLHPCVLETEAPSSANPRITRLRLLRRLKEIELVLAALIPRMKGAASGDRMTWVDVESAPSTAPSQLLPRGYRYPGLWDVGDYTDTAHLKPVARTVDGRETFPPQSELQLPDNLEASLDRYDLLPPDEKLSFQQAAHWLLTAKRIHGISMSGAHLALVNAAESLSGELNATVGPTQRFRQFMETYGGVLSPADSRALYSTRSNLSHGHRLLDEDLGSDLFGRATATDRSMIGLLEFAVRSAIEAWLHRPLQQAIPETSVDG